MSEEIKTQKKAPYSYLGLPDYMGRVATKSMQAPCSRIEDMDPASIRPTHNSHLALVPGNFDAVASWWQAVLNAKPSLAASGMRFLSIDGEHHRVVVFENPSVRQRSGPGLEFSGLHHIAFRYAGFRELAATYLRLKEQGIKRRELLPAVRRHVEEVIFSLFAWEEGSFVVIPGGGGQNGQ